MNISLIRNCRDTHPWQKMMTFDELARMLTTFRPAPAMGKDALPAWLPASFSGKRCARNVIEVCAFVLDIDDGTTLSRGMDLWQGHAKILHTSWSHTPEKPKFRIVFPLAEPVPASHWKRTWLELSRRARASAVTLDVKCCNGDRIYYLPATSPESDQRVGVAMPGRPLEVDWRSLPDIDALRKERHVRYYAKPPSGPDYKDAADRERLATRIGATMSGDNRAHHITCPQCGEHSVWYFIDPERMTWARCNHRLTCGWEGPLDRLDRVTA